MTDMGFGHSEAADIVAATRRLAPQIVAARDEGRGGTGSNLQNDLHWRDDRQSSVVTPTGLSTGAQHRCCKSAGHGDDRRVDRNKLALTGLGGNGSLSPETVPFSISRWANSDTSQTRIIRQRVLFVRVSGQGSMLHFAAPQLDCALLSQRTVGLG